MEKADFPPVECRLLDDDPDAVVAAEAVHRNQEAMRVLFERYKGTVFNIARRIVRDDGEAEDVCQLVYIEAFARIETFDPAKGPFKNWLLTRAVHRSINRKRQLETERLYISDSVELHAESAVDGEGTQFGLLPAELSCLTGELASILRLRERRVIELTFCESLTRQEIATHLGITVSAVRHSLKKGLQLLHSALTNGHNGTRKDPNG